MKRIREVVVTVFMSVWKKLNPLRERNTFEVFGWDFLLDEEFRVWLIEVLYVKCICIYIYMYVCMYISCLLRPSATHVAYRLTYLGRKMFIYIYI